MVMYPCHASEDKEKGVDCLAPSEIEIANIGVVGGESVGVVREKHTILT